MGVVALLALASSACTGGSPGSSGPSVRPAGARILYVAVGASETVGFGTQTPLRQAWPQVFFRSALPLGASFVNLGVPGATVQDALELEVPEALPIRPQLVTVWLNVNDLIAGVPPATYERELDELVRELRQDGRARVLLANTPPLDHLPAYLRCAPHAPSEVGCDPNRLLPPSVVNATVAAYNAATARVVQHQGAVLVDLHAAGMAARAGGTESSLVSGDGFHPSAAGHTLVARTFAAALKRAWPSLVA